MRRTKVNRVESEPGSDFAIQKIFAVVGERKREQQQVDQEEEKKSPQDLVGDWPSQMAQIVLDEEAYLRDNGFDPEKIPQALLKKKREVENMYLERKFQIPNKDYMRLEGAKVINEIFSEDEPNPEKTRNIGVINIDLNGLKCVNDLPASHEKGDQYLKMVVDILKDGTTTRMAKEMGINVFLGRQNDAGDEFTILLSGDVDLTSEREDEEGKSIQLIEWITKKYQNEIYIDEREKFTELIEFFDRKGKPNKDIHKRAKGIDIPKDFKFRGSISAGCSVLGDILLEIGTSNDENVLAGKSYNDLLAKFFGQMLHQSDELSNEDKILFKQMLAESEDINERTLGMLLQRTEESIRKTEENEKLRAELAKEKKLRKKEKRLREKAEARATALEIENQRLRLDQATKQE